MAFSLHLNKGMRVFSELWTSKFIETNANINCACWIGGDTEIRRSITLDHAQIKW